MRLTLVVGLFVVVAAGAVAAGQLQGEWDSELVLGLTPTLGLYNFYSLLDIQYLVSGWTLEAAAYINEYHGLDELWFEAYGSLGAFSVWSLADFPLMFGPEMVMLESAAEASIAGVDLYGLLAIWHGDEVFSGSGFALGGILTAGEIRLGAEITWNLYSNLWGIFVYGLYGWVTDWTNMICSHPTIGGTDVWWPMWDVGFRVTTIDFTCDAVFSYITGVAQLPVCCADIYVMARFSCTGFDCVGLLAKNVDIGLDWLEIYQLGFTYTLTDKKPGVFFQVVTGDVVCFKPYFTAQFDEATAAIQGITLNALTLSCTVDGCEFYWGHIFNHHMQDVSGWYWESGPCGTAQPGYYDFYFLPVGPALSAWPFCVWTAGGDYPNEMFGVRCDEDGCCGGLFSFGVNNFFNTEDTVATGIFGWMGTYAEVTAGVGPNTSLVVAMNLTALGGVEWIAVGANIAW